jgi:hypothetical protein
MSKKSRKKRHQQNLKPKHDFVKTLTTPRPSKQLVKEPVAQLEQQKDDSPTIKIAGQRKDIITTLVIAGVILCLFLFISIADKKTQLLSETGDNILNTLNLKL